MSPEIPESPPDDWSECGDEPQGAVHNATEQILKLQSIVSNASGLAGELAAYAKTGGIPGVRPHAARLLYYLTRDLTIELRKIFEARPEWFEGVGDPPDTEDGLLVRLKREHLTSEEKRLQRIGMAAVRLIARWRRSNPFPRDYRPGEHGQPVAVPVDTPEDIRGSKFSKLVESLGLEEAARSLPPPAGGRDGDVFKAWWQVAWPIYMASRARDRTGKPLAEKIFRNWSSGYEKPIRLERERVKRGIVSGFEALKGGR